MGIQTKNKILSTIKFIVIFILSLFFSSTFQIFAKLSAENRTVPLADNEAAAWPQWRLPLNSVRDRNLQNLTAASAGLLPPLRQTVRCVAGDFYGAKLKMSTTAKLLILTSVKYLAYCCKTKHFFYFLLTIG